MAMQWQRDLPEAQGSRPHRGNREKELYRSEVFNPTKHNKFGEYQVVIHVRWDDRSGNGSNSFYCYIDVVLAGSGKVSENIDITYGVPDHIIDAIPGHLLDLKKWDSCHPFGPWYYIENTLTHAGDRDCWGLRKGESKQIVNGRTGLPAWELVAVSRFDGVEVPLHTLTKNKDAPEQPICDYDLEYRPWCRIGEGSERQLDYARSTAIWPDATDDQLMSETLATDLQTRLPALLVEFRTVIESLGFEW